MKTNFITKIKTRELTFILVGLLAGFAFGKLLLGNATKETQAHEHSEAAHAEKTIYTCSMHPQIRQEEPGNCPICGMELIPLASLEKTETSNPNAIELSESAAKLAEIETQKVSYGKAQKTTYLLGKISADERTMAKITARFGGRIEKLFVNFTGQEVKKGEKLATLYSPELIAAQRELIEALNYKSSNPKLYAAARSKLLLWGLTEAQIDHIETQKQAQLYFNILAPIEGTVLRRNVSEGEYIKEGSSLMQLADLNHIWVLFDAYEPDLPWIHKGDTVQFNLSAQAGKTYSGKIDFIDPVIDPKTRVAQLRISLSNPGNLKPGMFVNGVLQSTLKKDTPELLIPKTSVLWTGKRSLVYVKDSLAKTPTFIGKIITLGPQVGEYYVVEQGLEQGEEVATHGVFKIDASAQLAGNFSMMNPKKSALQSAEPEKKTNAVPLAFQKQLGKFTNVYFELKDAFVATNAQEVEAKAKLALGKLNQINMELLKGEQHTLWMPMYTEMKKNLQLIISTSGIAMKRHYFSLLSDKLTETIDKIGVDTGSPLYLQFCPMAFDNKGAYWISNEKQIMNPYFGDMMLHCGEVKRTFK